MSLNIGPPKTGGKAEAQKVDPTKLDPASNPDGFTNAAVNQALTTGSLAKSAADLAAKFPTVHELLGELKTLYESAMGKVALSAIDWHWQATNLKHFLANGSANAGAPAAPAKPAATSAPSHPSPKAGK